MIQPSRWHVGPARPSPSQPTGIRSRHAARRRIWSVVSPTLVATTAAVTLLGSAAIVPSFATPWPDAPATGFVGSQGLDGPGTRTARSQGPVAAGVESAVVRLALERHQSLDAASSQIRATGRDALLQAHRSRSRRSSAAIRAENRRLRDLNRFLWPTQGGVSSGFGWRVHPILGYRKFHNGADISGACNNPVYAAESGTVTKTGTGFSGGSGNNVRINHGTFEGNTIETAYLHLNRFLVKSGQYVKKGELIGVVGSTGLSTACHLHLSLYKNGKGSDPLEYVKK